GQTKSDRKIFPAERQVGKKMSLCERNPELFRNRRRPAEKERRNPVRVRPDRLPDPYDDQDRRAAKDGSFVLLIKRLPRTGRSLGLFDLRRRECRFGLHTAATIPSRSDSSSINFQTESSSSRNRGSRFRLRFRGRVNGTLKTSLTRPGRAL